MLSTKEATELQELSYLIHTQVLTEHGNVLNHPHEQALRALHATLARMVNGENSGWHGRWCIAAPVGFGKSSGIASFIVAAYQLGLLGNGVTMTLTASRVGQLYDFEKSIIDNGIPKAEIRKFLSVLHFSDKKTLGVERESDQNLDVPVLLMTHNKITRTYRPREDRRVLDLTYFLKYRDEPRDLVVWDERCMTSEAISLPLDALKQSVVSLGASEIGGRPESHQAVTWIETLFSKLQHEAAQAKASQEERVLENLASIEERNKFHAFLKRTPGYNHSLRTNLYILLDLLKFPLRVLPTGIISYRVVVPDCIENMLVLDASFSVSALSQMDATMNNLEDAHPLLLNIQRRYGKRLKDLKDCSDLTFVHWNKGAGKDALERETEIYLKGEARDGNLMHEVIGWLKPRVAEGKAVLLCTNKTSRNGVDLAERVKACLQKGGLDLSKTVIDPRAKSRDQHGNPQPVHRTQINVDTYGRLDSSNAYAYCPVTVNLGVQQLKDIDVSAAVSGQKRDIKATTDEKQRKFVTVAERAVVVEQSHGRGQSRIVVNGKALPQEALLVYEDTKEGNLTSVLKPLYHGATWKTFRARTVKADGKPKRTILEWVEIAKACLNGLPPEQSEISSRALKVLAGAQDVPTGTWKHITRTINEDRTFPWNLCERSFVHQGRFLAKSAA